MITPLVTSQAQATIALVNPLAGPDKHLAYWFHAHLTPTFVTVLRAFSEVGSGEWIGFALFFLVLFLAWKRWWPSLFTMVVAVPGGMLLNEWIKVLVHRPRPFVTGPFVDWSGYSFASGHTIGATLLYGQLALFIVPALKNRHWRVFALFMVTLVVGLVGFSRMALGAHYLTDVLGGIVFGIIWLAVCLFVCKAIQRNRDTSLIPGDLLGEEGAMFAAVRQANEGQQALSLASAPAEAITAPSDLLQREVVGR